MGPALSDYNMRLIQLSVIQLSGGHCTSKMYSIEVNIRVKFNCQKEDKVIKNY